MEEKDILKEIDFDNQESEIYLYLLKNGPCTQQEISDNLQIIRQTIYDIIKKMMNKGNVSLLTEGKQKLYAAIDPDILLLRIREKEEKIQAILPSLKKSMTLDKSIHSKSFFGIEGLKDMFSLTLIQKDQINWAANLKISDQIFKEFYWDNYAQKRIDKKIPLKLLLEDTKKLRYKSNKQNFLEIKKHSILNKTASSFFTFGNNTVIYSITNDIPFGVLIQNKEIKDFLEKIFLELWKNSTD